MYGSPRNASIVAKTEMKLYELHRDAFRFVMVDTAQSGSEKLISFLRKVELLKGMNDRDLGRLSEALEPVSYTDGQTIITEGDTVADYFYIIERGTVVVSSEGEEVVRRHEGEYFGELALLKNVARIATVTAAGDDVVLLQLSRQKFQTLFGTIGSGTDWAARKAKREREVG
jgi:cAMP-dependent protein kinase regulator